jgi:NAD(P)H-hydrate epimerase
MQLPPLTRDQVRRVDQIAIEQYAIPGIVLMENAGRGAAEVIDRVAGEGRITILCGAGNNGGDGYVIARHLELLGRSVEIVSLVDPESLSGDAAINATIAAKSQIKITRVTARDQIDAALEGSATVVDAMLGTGAKGSPRDLFADAVRSANDCQCLRIAIDLPTGLDCDSGVANEPTFRADHTITFVSRKVGFEKENADAYVGVLTEIGIGVPSCLLAEIRNWTI